jgi:small subunit ribosomal protein S21
MSPSNCSLYATVCVSDATGSAHWLKEEQQVQILVRDNNVDQGLKVHKKKTQCEGVFREMKIRRHYEKPSEKRAREKAEVIRRARKLARKKLQRGGLLQMKPPLWLQEEPGPRGPLF